MKARRPKAYSYIRFSTPEQAKGDSLARQLKLSQDYAEAHGFDLDAALSLRDLGLSGFRKTNITKGALGGFLAAVEKGMVPRGSMLLVESLDRLSRAQITDQMTLFLNLINAGINVVTLTDKRTYTKETIDRQMSELLYSLVIMSRGHEESATKSKRLKSAWAGKRANARTNILTARAPAWLSVDKATRKFIKIKDRSGVVEQIFDWADKGTGKETIAKRLNTDGVPVWGKGRGWHASYIQKILQSRAVLGEFQPHRIEEGKRVPDGEPIKDYFPRIISDELFFRTLNRRTANARFVGRARTSNANLFSGLLKDGYTGSSVVFVNKGEFRYLVADDARRGLGGSYMSWRYDHFEASFLTFLKELTFTDLLDQEWKTKRDALEAEIRREVEERRILERQSTRLVEAIAQGNAPKAIVEKISALQTQIDEIETRVESLTTDAKNQGQLEQDTQSAERKTRSLLARKNEPEAREILRQEIRRQVSKIVVFSGGPVEGIRGLADVFFTTIGSDTSMTAKQLKNSSVLQEKLLEKFRESINNRSAPTEIPSNRSRRYFVVYFKTGAAKYVMPDPSNPRKLQRIMSIPETKAGELPKLKAELASGIKLSFEFDKPKRLRTRTTAHQKASISTSRR